MSEAEVRLWAHLRDRFETKWRRQEPIGAYVTDFLCYSRRLVVEVDGEHHARQRAYDERRDRYLESQGFRVLRVAAYDVMADIEGVLETVDAALGG